MSQFALPRFPRGPFYQCIAVSQGPDPTGSWHRYEFTMSQTKLNDYPKFGVWPDGYYMAINQFSCSIFGCSWGGQGVVAFERDAMLNGAPARMVYFDLYSVNANLGGMLPSDLDGPPPPLGAPNYFVEVDDSTWGFPRDQLQIWEFHVDWSNPANLSTFNHNLDLATAGFNPDLCGYARNCIPQGNSAYKVDAISDRLMYRLQYRNFGDYQTLVTNHTVDVNGADRAGIRWYELRNSGGGWSIRQQGTYSPGTDHRWMGSIAMNGQGDIALGYSRTNASPLYPSVYATGRLASDDATTPLGQLPQPELMIVNGSGYQTHSAARWGDYSQMTVDPLDDCTFWYTQEYYQTTGSAPWQTRIASIQLGDCGPGTPPAAPTLLTATPGDGEVSLSWTGSAGADTYNVKRATASGGPYAAVSTGVATTSYTDTTVTNGTTYYYVVTAVNSVDESANSNETSATPAAPIAPEGPTHLTATPGDGQVSLSWTGSVGADTYNVKRSTISGGSYSSVSTGVATTSYTDTTVTNGTTYYYVVTAVNSVDESANSNEASATPAASPVPATPSNLVATGGPGKKQIKLSWNAAQGATSHNIYRGTASGGPYVLTATGVSSTNYTNTGLSSGTTYYYVVTGVNSSGEGPASNEATATAR
ncbi:MAG: hypothetical protein HYX73_06435 [Acidobacteria bacterium]|nr:hypothetical protein [Acidobacteriota bacterium]